MILVIDIGNTTIAFTGLRKKPGEAMDFLVMFEDKLPTETGRDPYRFQEEARALCRRHGIVAAQTDDCGGLSGNVDCGRGSSRKDRENCGAAGGRDAEHPGTVSLTAVSSVVPACTPAAMAFAGKISGAPPVCISRRCDSGLRFHGIPAPDRLGADRVADAAWAAAAAPLPAMTVDLGTATTINVIGGKGEFLGGMIGAGVRTSLQALGHGTAQLPPLEPRTVRPGELIGTDTAECMRSAAIVGTACMIDGFAARVEERLGQEVSLLLTGGNASFVAPWVRHPFIHEPALAAKGAALIALRETERVK